MQPLYAHYDISEHTPHSCRVPDRAEVLADRGRMSSMTTPAARWRRSNEQPTAISLPRPVGRTCATRRSAFSSPSMNRAESQTRSPRARPVVVDQHAHTRFREVDDPDRDRLPGRDRGRRRRPGHPRCRERHPRRAPLVALGLDVDHPQRERRPRLRAVLGRLDHGPDVKRRVVGREPALDPHPGRDGEARRAGGDGLPLARDGPEPDRLAAIGFDVHDGRRGKQGRSFGKSRFEVVHMHGALCPCDRPHKHRD